MNTAANTGGVDEAPNLAGNFNLFINWITSGSCEIVDDDAFFTSCFVEQRRLTHVGASENRNATRTTHFLLSYCRNCRKLRNNHVKKVRNTTSVESRNGIGLAESERPKSRNVGLLTSVIDLVCQEVNRNLGLSQELHNVLIGCCSTDVAIHHEQDSIREVDRNFGLCRNRCVDALGIWLPATGVNESELTFHPLCLVVHAVAGHTRSVFHYCFTATDNAVNQSRLTHVGTTNHGQHRKCRKVGDLVWVFSDGVEKLKVFLVQVIVFKACAQRSGAGNG